MQINKFTYLFLGILFLGFLNSANAATITVNNISDLDNTTGACTASGSCSIRQAVNAAIPGDTINFNIPAAICPGSVCTIALELGPLQIKKNLNITGTGARSLILTRGTDTFPGASPIISMVPTSEITVAISNLTITRGSTMGGGGGIGAGAAVNLTLDGVAITECFASAGGGIYYTYGNLNIINSTIAGNYGSAIYNENGNVTIANSTISGNHSGQASPAGGIKNGYEYDPKDPEQFPTTAALHLNNVTITGNIEAESAVGNSGGIVNFNVVDVRNTIIGGNQSTNGFADVCGVFNSLGNNLVTNAGGSGGFSTFVDVIGQAPGLGALSNNGGQTDTHVLLPNSPAINKGNNCVTTSSCTSNNPLVPLTKDQRGGAFARNVGGTTDIGAYESQAAPTAAGVSIGGRVFAKDGRGLANALVTLIMANGETRTVATIARGNFHFDDVEAGQTVVIKVMSRLYQFSPQAFSVIDNIMDISLVPEYPNNDRSSRTAQAESLRHVGVITAPLGENK